jgi:hypothetical protein
MVAALVEAQEFNQAQIQAFQERVGELYGIPEDALGPLFEHQRVDVQMGHAELLAENLDLVEIQERRRLDRVVNGLHDLKHAFDLQGLEIKDYYCALGGNTSPGSP